MIGFNSWEEPDLDKICTGAIMVYCVNFLVMHEGERTEIIYKTLDEALKYVEEHENKWKGRNAGFMVYEFELGSPSRRIVYDWRVGF